MSGFFEPTTWLPSKTMAKIQYTKEGFHLMKISSCKIRVKPPSKTTMISVIRGTGSSLRFFINEKPTKITVTTMVAAVAA